MLKARIKVDDQTDIAEEMAALERLAAGRGLEPVAAFALVRDTELALSDLKRHDAETAPYEIALHMSRTVAGPGYEVVVECEQRMSGPKNTSLLSRLLGR